MNYYKTSNEKFNEFYFIRYKFKVDKLQNNIISLKLDKKIKGKLYHAL